MPKKTNFIVAANHVSYMDPFAIGTAIPQRIYWIAQRDLYKVPLVKWFMEKTDSMPVGGVSGRLTRLVASNRNIGLFPEGARSLDGKIKQFRHGAVLLALKTGRPIVPCAILGAYESYPRSALFPKFFRRITVKIGRPQFLLKEFEDIIDDVYLQEGTLKIERTIKEMLYAN